MLIICIRIAARTEAWHAVYLSVLIPIQSPDNLQNLPKTTVESSEKYLIYSNGDGSISHAYFETPKPNSHPVPHQPTSGWINPSVPTASEQVFSNLLIMDNVYSSLPKKDLTNCMITCKDGLVMAAKALFTDVPEDLNVLLASSACPVVSLTALLHTRFTFPL